MTVLVSDLVLTDEHDTVNLDESLVDATKKLLSLPRGVLIVLDDGKVKGVMTSIQIMQAVADGLDMNGETCGGHVDTDVMEVQMEDEVAAIVSLMNERKPHAVVAVDSDGNFAGYFSPNDYREALAIAQSKPIAQALDE